MNFVAPKVKAGFSERDPDALYFLPLGYTAWIGLGCLAIALCMFVVHRAKAGPYQYVVEGRPIVARIRELQLVPTLVVNGIHDEMIPIANSYRLVENLPNAMLMAYPDAGHGFCCDERGSYNETACKLAWQRCLDFLKLHVNK